MCREGKTLENLVVNGTSLSTSSSQASEIYVEEKTRRILKPRVMDDSKETVFPETTGQLCTQIHRGCDIMPKTCMIKTDGVPSLRGIVHMEFPLITKKSFASDTIWQRENRFSLMKCHNPGQTP